MIMSPEMCRTAQVMETLGFNLELFSRMLSILYCVDELRPDFQVTRYLWS